MRGGFQASKIVGHLRFAKNKKVFASAGHGNSSRGVTLPPPSQPILTDQSISIILTDCSVNQ